ncbi:MAG: hypothetical protein HYS05_00255 [Acidobacteria bacterium]|nr:hypothetical protein [Acidobacteriota bacterium]
MGPSRMTLLAAALAVLLVVLAVVQYRWVGQVSDGEREQLRASLQRRGREFAMELNRELARAFATFQTTPISEEQDVAARLAAAWLEWTRDARYPRIIRDVYFVEPADGGGPPERLSRFNRGTGLLEATEWPAALEHLRPRFAREAEDVQRQGGSSFTIVRRHAPLAEEIPALVIPAIRFRSREEAAPPGTIRPALAYTIALLDVDYLRGDVLPALSEHHFNPAGTTPEFLVTVVQARMPSKVVFQSTASTVDPERVDLRQPLLEIRADDMGRVLLEQTRHAGPREKSRTTQLRFAVAVQQGEAAGGPPSATSAWQLLVTHRAGSVDAAIRAARTRNLTISFGILLLFGTSIALLVVSTERARRLADRQMEFVAAVSHELRTPLAVIRSAGENLADGVVADPSQVERYGRLIEEQGRSLSDMVEQVLAFAGAENGQRIAARQPVNIGELLADVIEATERITGGSLTLERSIDHELPPIEGNRDALRRVFQNLVDNAVKYSGDSSWIGVGASASGGELRVTITDRGMGIEASELRRIFEPFYRGRGASAAQIHGSGLGLSLVERIVQAHGGTVSVKSAPGHGSTFTVVLPAPPASSVNETSVAQTFRA